MRYVLTSSRQTEGQLRVMLFIKSFIGFCFDSLAHDGDCNIHAVLPSKSHTMLACSAPLSAPHPSISVLDALAAFLCKAVPSLHFLPHASNPHHSSKPDGVAVHGLLPLLANK